METLTLLVLFFLAVGILFGLVTLAVLLIFKGNLKNIGRCAHCTAPVFKGEIHECTY